MLAVDRKWVHALPMDVPTIIPDTNGVSVTLIDANHCPGSCLFFLEGLQTVNSGDSAFKSPFVGSPKVFRYLHCGDFRASPHHILHPAVAGKKIDHVYLDTTYLDPKVQSMYHIFGVVWSFLFSIRSLPKRLLSLHARTLLRESRPDFQSARLLSRPGWSHPVNQCHWAPSAWRHSSPLGVLWTLSPLKWSNFHQYIFHREGTRRKRFFAVAVYCSRLV